MSVRCDAGTQVDSNVTYDASMETLEVKEQPKKRTDDGAVEGEKEELKRKIAETAVTGGNGPPNPETTSNNPRNGGTRKQRDSLHHHDGANGEEFSAA
jgi:hypothetical protein